MHVHADSTAVHDTPPLLFLLLLLLIERHVRISNKPAPTTAQSIAVCTAKHQLTSHVWRPHLCSDASVDLSSSIWRAESDHRAFFTTRASWLTGPFPPPPFEHSSKEGQKTPPLLYCHEHSRQPECCPCSTRKVWCT